MGNHESKPEPKVDVVQVIQNNKNTIHLLHKKIVHSEKRMNDEIDKAKQCLKRKNKSKAMIHLKRKKMLEKQINNLHGQIMNLEQQSISLEGLTMNQQVVNTMKITSNTMKRMNKEMDVDKVDNLVSNIQDHMDDIEEVNQVLSTPIGDVGLMDDDELLAELEGLENEEECVSTTEIEKDNEQIRLPEVPKDTLIAQLEEDDVLNELEELMA
jgi:hypothetical protein